jgi:hypothetical protein
VFFFGVQVLCHMPRDMWAARAPYVSTWRGPGHGCVEGGENIASWPGAAIWSRGCAVSVADDTCSPKGTWETCRKALGTAGWQVRARPAICCAVTTPSVVP